MGSFAVTQQGQILVVLPGGLAVTPRQVLPQAQLGPLEPLRLDQVPALELERLGWILQAPEERDH